jgi:hypothetical protein
MEVSSLKNKTTNRSQSMETSLVSLIDIFFGLFLDVILLFCFVGMQFL